MKSLRSWTEIDLTNFRANIRALRAFLPEKTCFMQIVKADGYGHGAYEIARTACDEGAALLGVANSGEGSILRYRGIDQPILVLSPSLESEIPEILEYGLIPTIPDTEFARTLSKSVASPVRVHVNIDTGMGRSGLHYRSAKDKIAEIASLRNIKIEGIYSHFSSAEVDHDYTMLQQERFEQVLGEVLPILPEPPKWIHISASAGVVTLPGDGLSGLRGSATPLVRLGLLTYGIYPHESLRKQIALLPVMRFKTVISQIRTVHDGESVGYNRTFISTGETRYAILPVGYADGYDFLLSGRGKVRIRDRYCPVLGRVSMDMTAVDVTALPDVQVGDEAVLLGESPELAAETITARYGGSPYEILCQIGRRAQRLYYENGELKTTSPLARREFFSPDFTDSRLNAIIEEAISQRLQSREIASMIYGNLLRQFFIDRDREIHYRHDFEHTVTFLETADYPEYYEVRTSLRFRKILQDDHFIVACANRPEGLNRYFQKRNVEYRWLLDAQFDLNPAWFEVTAVEVDQTSLTHETNLRMGSIEIRCSHPDLRSKLGHEVAFSIETRTYYPRRSHQMSVFITEITQGVEVEFQYPECIGTVEPVVMFAGRGKFPGIDEKPGSCRVRSGKEEWIFPNSGIVFAY